MYGIGKVGEAVKMLLDPEKLIMDDDDDVELLEQEDEEENNDEGEIRI